MIITMQISAGNENTSLTRKVATTANDSTRGSVNTPITPSHHHSSPVPVSNSMVHGNRFKLSIYLKNYATLRSSCWKCQKGTKPHTEFLSPIFIANWIRRSVYINKFIISLIQRTLTHAMDVNESYSLLPNNIINASNGSEPDIKLCGAVLFRTASGRKLLHSWQSYPGPRTTHWRPFRPIVTLFLQHFFAYNLLQ